MTVLPLPLDGAAIIIPGEEGFDRIAPLYHLLEGSGN
jgi:hypothetical protein